MNRLGRMLLGAGAAGMGVLVLVFGAPVPGLEPLPAWMPAHPVIAYATGILLVAAGAGLFAGWKVTVFASVLGSLFFLWVVVLQVPSLSHNLHSGGRWGTAGVALALGGAAWIASGKGVTLGRFCYGVSLLVFGGFHFAAARSMATLVPAWIPGPYIWVICIGVAFVAAGLAIMTGIKGRLAAVLIAIMLASWVLIVHTPRVVLDPHSQDEWNSLLVAVAMSGGALLVAGVSRARARS